jgi:hypothetical protein
MARGHAGGEAPFEFAADLGHDDETLGVDTALTGVDEPGRGAGFRGQLQVGILEDQVGIAAAQLEDAGFHRGAGERRHLAAGGGAAGQGDGADVRVGDEGGHHARAHEQGLQQAGREAGVGEDLLDGEGAAGDVGRVFQEQRVARHQRGGPRRERPARTGSSTA